MSITPAASARLRDLAVLRRVRDPAGNLIRIQELPARQPNISKGSDAP